MSSVHPSQLPGLVTDMGYSVMMAAYAQEEQVRSRVAEIVPISGSEYGFTGKVIVGADEPDIIKRGEAAPARTFDEGYQWFAQVKKLAESIIITEELLNDPNASAKIGSIVSAFAKKFGEGFARKKEKMAADFFNYGAYTAGRIDVFDGTYTGHAATYPKFIYDGKPWFGTGATAHPLFLSSSTTKANYDTNALSSTNLEAARILMQSTNAVDEANQKISIDPNLLVVPPDLAQTAEVILNSIQLPGTAQNDINTLRGRFGLVSWRFLTDTDGWFLGRGGKGIRFYDSGDPILSTEPLNDGTGSQMVRLRSYFGGVVDDWRWWSAHKTAQS